MRVMLVDDCEGQSSSASAAGRQQHRLHARRSAARLRVQRDAGDAATSVFRATTLPARSAPLHRLRTTHPMPRYRYVELTLGHVKTMVSLSRQSEDQQELISR